MIRFYLIGALALALAASIWWQDRTQKKLNATRVELSQKNAELEARDKLIETERNDRKLADVAATNLQTELDAIRAARKPVSVYCRPASVSTAAESGASAVPDGSSLGSSPEGAFQDIGAALADVWEEHESNNARHRALIEWERNRTH